MLRNSTSQGLAGGVSQYYLGGWQNIPGTTDGDGTLLAAINGNQGSLSFSMTYNSARQEKSQNIASNSFVVFQTQKVLIQLKNSSGTLVDPGTGLQYYAGGWHTFGTGSTSGGQASMELLPMSYSFALTYGFARQEKSQNVSVNATVVFQTTKVTLQLEDSSDAPPDGTGLQYYAGGWHTFGTGSTSGGEETMELLPMSYSFAVTYAFARQEKSQNVSSNPTVVFQTTSVTLQLKDSSNAPLDGTGLQFYAGGWHQFGTGATTGGSETMELLPMSYSFAVSYAFARQEKSQNVSSNPTVVFQTGQVHSDLGTATLYYSGGWRTFTQDMELLPLTYTFHFSDFPETNYSIAVPRP